jgi:CheY-like chemotaxis protein/nitrogen-specific signal transduction histidine kinase
VEGLLLTAVISELRAARRSAERQTLVAQVARREGEAANRTKDEFLATVSHELRTPLNAVLGWVHLLRTGKLDHTTSTRGLESIERNVRLQAQVTSDLLDVSKALTGKLQLDSGPTLLTNAARQAIRAVSSAAQAKGVEIRQSLPDAPVVVIGDPTRLRQIVWHLLANAMKFTPAGGVIDIEVEATDGEARLTVSDSGRGIDPQFLPHIFERFAQADQSATRTTGGLGVGLALVRQLVELHGGEIEARNRSDGGGAILAVRLPLHASEVPNRGRLLTMQTTSSTSWAELEGVRVLVLDQNQEGRDLLRALLQERGATVQTVDSVADALETLEAWRPDVLISDAGTAERDSYTIVGKVHALDADRGGRIPAVALTTVARTDQRLAPMLSGVHSDLPKPIEPIALTAEVARLAGRERRHAQR